MSRAASGVLPTVGRVDLETLQRRDVTVAALEQLYRQTDSPSLAAERAVRCIDQLDAVNAWKAIWLVHRLSLDRTVDEALLLRLVEQVDSVDHWLWRLLACQLFARAGCPRGAEDDLIPFLLSCRSDPRVIVRAWALSALWPFRAFPRHREDIADFLRAAVADPKPSMRARLRHLSR